MDDDSTRRPVGLFINPFTANQYTINSFGVDLEPYKHQERARHTQIRLPAILDHSSRTFPPGHFRTVNFPYMYLTKASLMDIKRLKMQTRRNRCIGLYIEHYHGVPEILGQWDPADTDATSALYEDKDDASTLDALTFIFSDETEAAERHCLQVVVGRGDSIPLPTFIYDDFTSVSNDMQRST